MEDYVGKYLLLVYDFTEISQRYGWHTDIGEEYYGHMAYASMKIDKHLNKLLNNEKLNKYLTSNLNGIIDLEKAEIFDAENILEKRINKCENCDRCDYIKLFKTYIFGEIYERFKKKLTNDEFNILFLAAFEYDDLGAGCGGVFDDERFLEDEDGYYLKWTSGKKQKIYW